MLLDPKADASGRVLIFVVGFPYSNRVFLALIHGCFSSLGVLFTKFVAAKRVRENGKRYPVITCYFRGKHSWHLMKHGWGVYGR